MPASRSFWLALCLALSSWFFVFHAHAGLALEGKVVGVSDGDTITVLTDGRESIRIRLAEIDAPEKSQAFGQRSKQSLSDMVFSKTVRVEQRGCRSLWACRGTRLRWRNRCECGVGTPGNGVGLPPI